ncbi:MAG TPA: 4'-phosphopantetheinyl transferase superfamily protein [Streptosporangiaceae bacterium]|nr:4'-phosphopantetheinyl transferase superfamily protein [Streptosporangiaceae bacterium]
MIIGEILPPEVAAAEAFDDTETAVLFPEEEAAVMRAVPRRREEFATGRACARAALARLGLPPVPIVPGDRGAPRWPDGVAGSITHCAGYRAAAVARVGDVAALGLDAEPNAALPGGVIDRVALARERAGLPGLAAAVPGVCWDRLLFCAKEAVYKAWFPLTGRWLGFEQAEITVEPEAGTFRADLLVPGTAVAGRALDRFTGRWLARDGLLLAAVVVPAAARSTRT